MNQDNIVKRIITRNSVYWTISLFNFIVSMLTLLTLFGNLSGPPVYYALAFIFLFTFPLDMVATYWRWKDRKKRKKNEVPWGFEAIRLQKKREKWERKKVKQAMKANGIQP